MYLTYEEYKNLGGALDEATFNDFEFESECIINWYTFDRLKKEVDIPVEVKMCTNALIKLCKVKADAMTLGSQTTQTTDAHGETTTVVTNPTIASQSNDGVSTSYNTVSASEVFDKLGARVSGGAIENLVKMYLQGVVNSLGRKLLYRGLYENE